MSKLSFELTRTDVKTKGNYFLLIFKIINLFKYILN